jgi:hypothetical protein
MGNDKNLRSHEKALAVLTADDRSAINGRDWYGGVLQLLQGGAI